MEDYNLRYKKITTPEQLTDTAQVRDTFQTPNYAVDLLIPFIPKSIQFIWEPACGDGKIVKRLEKYGYGTVATDIRFNPDIVDTTWNFLDERNLQDAMDGILNHGAIITNPPYSIKTQFIDRAMEYKVPWAMLINADYSGQQIKWITEYGCEKIIPNRRIGFITPNILTRIHEGEIWELYKKLFPLIKKLDDFKDKYWDAWNELLETHETLHNYDTIKECPNELLAKYTSSQFHSMWLTYGFNLGRTETFVELSNKEIKENI